MKRFFCIEQKQKRSAIISTLSLSNIPSRFLEQKHTHMADSSQSSSRTTSPPPDDRVNQPIHLSSTSSSPPDNDREQDAVPLIATVVATVVPSTSSSSSSALLPSYAAAAFGNVHRPGLRSQWLIYLDPLEAMRMATRLQLVQMPAGAAAGDEGLVAAAGRHFPWAAVLTKARLACKEM